MYPSYLESYENKRLDVIIHKAFSLLESCNICPRRCKVNRIKNQLGYCKTGILPKVYSCLAHHGEEPPISGSAGSGAIFFSNCNLHCVYCQNYRFSQLGEGREVGFEALANFMLKLQGEGCHNINLVTPTHVMPQILKALSLAIPRGLNIPLIYNTSGYELPEMINLLEGIVDIYLPDMRYAEAKFSEKYSHAVDYPEYNTKSVKEMHRQVGVARINKSGIIERGLIIRHLVLPNNISGTEKIIQFISQELSEDTYISLMSQYLPCFNASRYLELFRRITEEEYNAAIKIMERYGLYNGWIQESGGLERFAGTNIKPI